MATGKARGAQAPKAQSLSDRLEAQIEWYDRKATANQRAYKISQIAIIACAIVIPIVAEFSHIAVGIAAGAILLLEGLQHVSKWQENWILYRATCEGLRHEQHLFAEKAGPYADLKPELAQRALAERTGSLVMAEHSKWIRARSEKSETTTGG
jgi:hypothetical protein